MINQVIFIYRLLILACTDSQSQLANVEGIHHIDGQFYETAEAI